MIFSQLWKTPFPKFVKPLPIVTDSRSKQPLNANSPIEVTLSPITIDLSPLNVNAYSSIVVTHHYQLLQS